MCNGADYPRTLIVGAHFSEQSGVGTFLGRLFSGWPTDRLATACGEPFTPDWRRCQRHYRTAELRFPMQMPINWLVPVMRPGPVYPSPPAATPTYSGEASPKVSLHRRLARYPWRALLRLTSGGDILYRVGPSRQLLAWVRAFHPDVIMGIFPI